MLRYTPFRGLGFLVAAAALRSTTALRRGRQAGASAAAAAAAARGLDHKGGDGSQRATEASEEVAHREAWTGGLNSFPAAQKVWIDNLPQGSTDDDLLDLFSKAGRPRFATAWQGFIKGSGGVAFDTPEETVRAIEMLSGSLLKGAPIKLSVWKSTSYVNGALPRKYLSICLAGIMVIMSALLIAWRACVDTGYVGGLALNGTRSSSLSLTGEPSEAEEKNEITTHVGGIYRFHDSGIEQAFRLMSDMKNMRNGALSMLGIALLGLGVRVTTLLDRLACNNASGFGKSAWKRGFCLQMAALILSVGCCMRPGRRRYWVCIVLTSIILLLLLIPPFQFDCQAAHEFYSECHSEYWKERWLQYELMHDCEILGSTAMQSVLFFISVLPYTLPSVRTMYLGWIWVYCMWFVVAVCTSNSSGGITRHMQDIWRQSLILSLALVIAIRKKAQKEWAERKHFLGDWEARETGMALYSILEFMLPEHVIIRMLKNPGQVIAEHYERVSVMFVVISDFNTMERTLAPSELLNFLNEYFSVVDGIIASKKVTKIETVSEEYVACVGVTPEDVELNKTSGHSVILARLVEAVKAILDLQADDLALKIGIHTGPLVAGVIGHKLPRYRLVGDTVNTAARMMQKGVVGHAQFGEETNKDMPKAVMVRERGPIEMKGKGHVNTFLSDGSERVEAGAATSAQCMQKQPSSAMAKLKTVRNDCIFKAFMYDPRDGIGGSTGLASITGRRQNLLVKTAIAKTFGSMAKALGEDQEAVDDLCHENIASLGHSDALLVDKFEHVLKEVDDLDTEQPITTSEELPWARWHHLDLMSRSFVKRVLEHCIVLSVVTFVELLYLLWSLGAAWCMHVRYGSRQLWVFLGCRMLCLLLLGGGMAVGRHTPWKQWFRGDPKSANYIAASYGVCACLMVVSYDAMARQAQHGKLKLEGPPSRENSYDASLFCGIMWVYMTCMAHPVGTRPAICYLCLAGVLLFFRDFLTVMYISEQGAAYLMGIAALSVVSAYREEALSLARFRKQHAVAETRLRIEGILNTLMPPLVADQMRRQSKPRAPPSHHYRTSIVAQSDLCGFTKLAACKTPTEVVGFLGDLFGRFDALVDKHELYKVETIGDAYIAGQAERPLSARLAPISVVLFALDMTRTCEEWASDLGVDVQCRVGIHFGACVGGIVGTGMQRYHLFGRFMGVLELLESTSAKGMVHVSTPCKEAVEGELREAGRSAEEVFGGFARRGERSLLTSKGEVHGYDEVGGATYLIPKPKPTLVLIHPRNAVIV